MSSGWPAALSTAQVESKFGMTRKKEVQWLGECASWCIGPPPLSLGFGPLPLRTLADVPKPRGQVELPACVCQERVRGEAYLSTAAGGELVGCLREGPTELFPAGLARCVWGRCS